MSEMVIPARSSTAFTAGIGPRPMISGRMAATEEATMRARGFRPRFAAFSADITSTAAAPSLSGHALPAVTVPPGRKAGLSSARLLHRGPGTRAVVAADLGAVRRG